MQVCATFLLLHGTRTFEYQVGERLGYGITLILAMEVIKLYVNEMVPIW